MKPYGVIYSYTRNTIGRIIGKLCIYTASFILLFLFLPFGIAAIRTELSHTAPPARAQFSDYITYDYFSLTIPAISAYSPIIPNVSLTSFDDALRRGVAHAAGTYFPGQGKTIYLFAHSTDSPLNIAQYNAIFYNLRRLTTGEHILVDFLGKRFTYRVTQTTIVQADDTSWLTRDFGQETLILQTCDPPGTTWRRLLVIAHRVV